MKILFYRYKNFLSDVAFEFGGTFLLCLIGYGYYGWLALKCERFWYLDALIPIFFAVSVSATIYLMKRFRRIAYLSPSITLLFFLGGQVSFIRLVQRILFQLLGYLLAAVILNNLWGEVNFYPSKYDNALSYVVETAASWSLAMAVALVGKSNPRQSKPIMPIAIIIILLGWTAGSYSGAMMNHGLYCAKLFLEKSHPQILYLVSPILGTVLAYITLSLWYRCGTYRSYCQQRRNL